MKNDIFTKGANSQSANASAKFNIYAAGRNTRFIMDLLNSRTLTDRHRKIMYYVLEYLLKNVVKDRDNVIPDIFNEAYIRISETDTFDDSRQLGPWVRKVAQSAYSDYFRVENRHHKNMVDLVPQSDWEDQNTEEDVLDSLNFLAGASDCPYGDDNWEQKTIREETLAEFRKKYSSLSEIEREIVEKKADGMMVRDIAVQLDKTQNAVSMHLHRIRHELESYAFIA